VQGCFYESKIPDFITNLIQNQPLFWFLRIIKIVTKFQKFYCRFLIIFDNFLQSFMNCTLVFVWFMNFLRNYPVLFIKFNHCFNKQLEKFFENFTIDYLYYLVIFYKISLILVVYSINGKFLNERSDVHRRLGLVNKSRWVPLN